MLSGLSKAERLQASESAMTHAMVITAVHLDDNGKPIRFKVENSWGEGAGDKGFFVMTAKWFDEYVPLYSSSYISSMFFRFVYQVVVPRELADKDLVAVLDGGDASVLPAWDPMVCSRPHPDVNADTHCHFRVPLHNWSSQHVITRNCIYMMQIYVRRQRADETRLHLLRENTMKPIKFQKNDKLCGIRAHREHVDHLS